MPIFKWILILFMLLLPAKAAYIELSCLEAENHRYYVLQFPGGMSSTSPIIEYVAQSLRLDWSNCLSIQIFPTRGLGLGAILDSHFQYYLGLITWRSQYNIQLYQFLHQFEAWETNVIRYRPPASVQLIAYLEGLSERVSFWEAYVSELKDFHRGIFNGLLLALGLLFLLLAFTLFQI